MNLSQIISASPLCPHLLLLLFLALATRRAPRLFCPEARGFDAYYHLIAARAVRANRFRIPRQWREFLLPGRYDYPPLYHYLLAVLPVRFHLKAETWSSALIDAIHAAVVYFFSLYCLGVLHPVARPAATALWVSILFLFSPALTSVGTGPRAYQGTPRTLGELLFTLAMAAAVCFRFGEGPAFFVAAAFFGGCLLLTSKFGVQVYFFIHLLLLLFDGRFLWLLLAAAGFLAAVIVSGGHYLVVARGHWEHSRYYRAVIAPKFHLVRQFNRWEDIRNLWHNLFRNPRQAVKTLLMDNSYTQLVIKHPQVFILAYLWAAGGVAKGDFNGLVAAWTAAGLAAFVLTSLKPLRFLGEADRYLEYTVVPQMLLLAGVAAFDRLAPVLTAYGVVWYLAFAAIFVLRFSEDARRLPAFREMAAFVRGRDDIRRILPIYLGEANQLAYESGKGVLHFPANFRRDFVPYAEFSALYEKAYPFPAEGLLTVMQRYRLDAVYYTNADLLKAEANGIRYHFNDWEPLFSNSAYIVMRPRGKPRCANET